MRTYIKVNKIDLSDLLIEINKITENTDNSKLITILTTGGNSSSLSWTAIIEIIK